MKLDSALFYVMSSEVIIGNNMQDIQLMEL